MPIVRSLTSVAVGSNRDPRVYVAASGAAGIPFPAGHVQELAWWSGGWHRRDLTQELHVPDTIGEMAATGAGTNLDPRVYTVATGSHIREFAWAGGGWHDRDLTAEQGAPAAAGKLAAMSCGANRDPRVYFSTAGGHIQEFSWWNGGWHKRDLTAELGAPAAAGALTAMGCGKDRDPRVYFVGAGGHIQEFSWWNGGWHKRDLTAELGAPAAAGALTAMGCGKDLDPRVYFVGAGSHIQEFSWWNGGWHKRDLTAELGAPAAAGALTAMGYDVDANPRVYFLAAAGHICELAWWNGGWHKRDLTAGLPGPTAAGPLTAMGFDGCSDPRVYFLPNTYKLHELAWIGSSWTIRDLMPANQESLPVTLIPQHTPMWCWAASAEMSMTYLGHGVSQCLQANYRLGRTDCCGSPTPNACVQGGWPQFEHWNFSASTVNGALTFDQLQVEIDCCRPIAFSWGWSGGGGHMMVARGYTRNVQMVQVNDPWPPNTGDIYFITYAYYVSAANHHSHWTDYYSICYTGPAAGAAAVAPAGLQEEVMPPDPRPDLPGPGPQHPADQPAAEPAPRPSYDDPVLAAQETLPLVTELVVPAAAPDMGFAAADAVPPELNLGEPLPIYVVPFASLQSPGPIGAEATDVAPDSSSMLVNTQQLFYPVRQDGEVVAAVTVAQRDGKWEMVSMGSANLAKTIAAVRSSTAERLSLAPGDFFIVNIPTLYLMFLAHRDANGALVFTHLYDSEEYGFESGRSDPAQTVLARLQTSVETGPAAALAEPAPVLPYYRP